MRNLKWEESVVLVTGATGSFGKKFIEVLLKTKCPKKLIIFSRDELKQHEMRLKFPDGPGSSLRYFIGDIRDRERLYRAFHGVDIVVHAAALKQVPACEYNPFEAVKTNILGAQNIIDAAIDNKVGRVLAVSTDKAVNPSNLYGATKLVAEKLFIQGNAYAGDERTHFSCVRYGNVVGSRGSVIPLFLKQKNKGKITITDLNMTRFWITLDQGVGLVINALETMEGGEIFVPKIPSMSIREFAEILAPNCEHEVIGIRPGEKIHETLISLDEARYTTEYENMFIIRHSLSDTNQKKSGPLRGGSLADDFSYSSDTNPEWLGPEELLNLIGATNENASSN